MLSLYIFLYANQLPGSKKPAQFQERFFVFDFFGFLGLILKVGSVIFFKTAVTYGRVTIAMMRRSAYRTAYNVVILEKICLTNGTFFIFNVKSHKTCSLNC